jgi:hypothetical protein
MEKFTNSQFSKQIDVPLKLLWDFSLQCLILHHAMEKIPMVMVFLTALMDALLIL